MRNKKNTDLVKAMQAAANTMVLSFHCKIIKHTVYLDSVFN